MEQSILADAGLPMIFVQMPVMLMALVPIILLEGLVARWRLSVSIRSAYGVVGIANIVSTFFGIPLAWAAMLVVNLVTTGGHAHGLESPNAIFDAIVLQAAWLVPYESDLRWMIPAASLVLLVPSFFASVLIERVVLVRAWPSLLRSRVTSTVWIANGASYSGLILVAVVWLLLALGRR